MNAYQPKTGVKCSCKRGVQRDNCPTCEGTGWVIDFAAIRARSLQPLAASASPASHTPGPWVTAEASPSGVYAMPCGCSIIREYRSFRGDSQQRYGIRWCAQHAAASDLLAALETMIEDAPSAEVYDMRESIAAARAAIKKAKGE